MKSLESIYNSIVLENKKSKIPLTDCIDGTYTINDDGSIDVDGSVILINEKLTKIPFKFRNVSDDFYCYDNQLTSLDGAPNTVGGNFSCYDNQLTSLDGAPITVGGGFDCTCNNLISLKGAPNRVGGNFLCYNNPNLPYSELFKIVDNVKDDIYYSPDYLPEDKDKIRRDRDVKGVLKDDELGSLDV